MIRDGKDRGKGRQSGGKCFLHYGLSSSAVVPQGSLDAVVLESFFVFLLSDPFGWDLTQ